MKKFRHVLLALSAAAIVGCGGGVDDAADVISEERSRQESASKVESKSPDLETAATKAANPAGAEAPKAPAAQGKEIGAMIEETIAAAAPLKLLQQAIDYYHSRTERGIDEKIEAALGAMEFETEQGMDRARAKLEAQMRIPPLQSLEGLVKERIITKVPPAPDGKKWSYDPSTRKVSLEDL